MYMEVMLYGGTYQSACSGCLTMSATGQMREERIKIGRRERKESRKAREEKKERSGEREKEESRKGRKERRG